MSLRTSLLISLCMLMFHGLSAQVVRIGIHPADKLGKFTFQAMADEVVIMTADSFPREIIRLNTLEQVDIREHAEHLQLVREGKVLGSFDALLFWCNDPEPAFKLYYGDRQSRSYPGHLQVSPGMRSLSLVNVVHIEDYIREVINAEAGHHMSLDFFKVQALSARTYALSKLNRHHREGFDLCDNTHCQAYKGQFRASPLIAQAVTETRGEVIVYEEDKLIDAVFSANCGGFTANSEDVWIANVEYLRAVPDYDFCEGFNNHAWHLTMPKLDFLAKLGRYLKVEATSFEVVPDMSGRVRRVFVNGDESKTISGEELRRLFRFKSSKFHLYDSNSLLFVEGAGFGHGVGMCQDGAYYLSKMGMDYERILRHYYQGITIRKIQELPPVP